MEIIEPKVEYWDEGSNPNAHVARCASLCYASENVIADKLVERAKRDKHLSIFRHQSHYYIISLFSTAGKLFIDFDSMFAKIFGQNPYVEYFIGKNNIYVSTNEQFVMEHEEFNKLFKKYEVDIVKFAENTEDKSLLRFTFCVTTSIKVSRELNRVSPNCITEQSTRYVNFGTKFGDVKVCKSKDNHLDLNTIRTISDILSQETLEYLQLIENGVKPEDARRVLPLDTATKVAYTYSFRQWKHIIDLRWFEVTGPAAPDAKVIGGIIYSVFKELGYYE